MTYHLMAGLYDQFMKDAPYDKWYIFTESIIEKYNLHPKKIIDLGCGTGEITLELAKKYDMTGVDLSTDMLTIAQQKAIEKNLNIRWLHQDLRELQGLSEFDIAVSYCDVMNYITTKEDVQKVFENVSKMIKEDGFFVFDVHSMNYVEDELVGNTFADVTEDNAYIWVCFPGDVEGEMYHELTFFASNGDDYSRFDETHHQRTFPITVYVELLKNCNLEIVDIYGDFSIENEFPEKNAERIFIVAQKRTR